MEKIWGHQYVGHEGVVIFRGLIASRVVRSSTIIDPSLHHFHFLSSFLFSWIFRARHTHNVIYQVLKGILDTRDVHPNGDIALIGITVEHIDQVGHRIRNMLDKIHSK
ncbi:hypothetical protein V6N13_028509 [Hibiscus sabdariffa]